MENETTSGYRTRQRELVLEYVKNYGGCVTADEVIKGLRKLGESVSKPTVYRTLDKFVRSGELSRFVSERGESTSYRFGGELHSEHFHLKCTECKKTVCVDCDFINSLVSHFYAHHGFALSPNQTVFYGVCADCRSDKV